MRPASRQGAQRENEKHSASGPAQGPAARQKNATHKVRDGARVLHSAPKATT